MAGLSTQGSSNAARASVTSVTSGINLLNLIGEVSVAFIEQSIPQELATEERHLTKLACSHLRFFNIAGAGVLAAVMEASAQNMSNGMRTWSIAATYDLLAMDTLPAQTEASASESQPQDFSNARRNRSHSNYLEESVTEMIR